MTVNNVFSFRWTSPQCLAACRLSASIVYFHFFFIWLPKKKNWSSWHLEFVVQHVQCFGLFLGVFFARSFKAVCCCFLFPSTSLLKKYWLSNYSLYICLVCHCFSISFSDRQRLHPLVWCSGWRRRQVPVWARLSEVSAGHTHIFTLDDTRNADVIIIWNHYRFTFSINPEYTCVGRETENKACINSLFVLCVEN